MEITKKKIAVIITTTIVVIAALVTILSFFGINLESLKGASIKIEGMEDRYGSDYNDDRTIEFIITNDGGELVAIDNIDLLQILGSGTERSYPNIEYAPIRPKIQIDQSVNMSITIPAHEARGTTEFILYIRFNDFKHSKKSDIFEVTWF